ncbi:MAG: exonuclease SbcC [Granulosicoccus sp.]|jgi:exonuclease SbcC
MLINTLIIQRFRGIPSRVEIDLSSPLTVIYAPNGTGKTSICDAVEWMLCGNISRLESSNNEDVECIFGKKDLQTFVEAKFIHQNKSCSLKRILNGDKSILFHKVESGEYVPLKEREVFSYLLADALPHGSKSSEWVRSTRFLESNSLGLLLDNDTESTETRKLIFSNLFGVSDYQKVDKKLSKILNKLPAISTINRERVKAKNGISDYQEKIKTLIIGDGDLHRDHAASLLNAIEKHLGGKVDVEKDSNLSDIRKQLEIKFIQSRESWERKKSILDVVEKNVHIFDENLSKKEELNQSLILEQEGLIRINHAIKNDVSEIEEKRKKNQQREETIRKIEDVLEKLKSKKVKSNRLFIIYKLPLIENETEENRLNKISEFISNKERLIFDLKKRILLIKDCIKLIPVLISNQNTLKGIILEIDALQMKQSSKNTISLEQQISEIKIKIDALSSFREKIMGDCDLLFSSGKKYIEMHKDDSRCPLCEHDHGNSATLQQRINHNFAKLSVTSKKEAALVTEYDGLVKLHIQESIILKKLGELALHKNTLAQQIKEAGGKFSNAGISEVDLDDSNILYKRLHEMHKNHSNEEYDLSTSIIPYIQAFESNKNLEEILMWFKSAAIFWSKELQQYTYVEPTSHKNLKNALLELESSLENHKTFSRQFYERENQEIKNKTATLDKINTEKDKRAKTISSYKELFVTITRWVDGFQKKWAIISDSSAITSQAIEAAGLTLDNEDQTHKEIGGFFHKVEDYFTKIKESEKKESERGVYRKELSGLERQLQEWTNQEEARNIIETEITSINKEISKCLSQEIQPLSKIISTLYLRAQGNKFVFSVEACPSDKGLLDWKINLGEEGKTLNKILSFSQGQRQDLALAIFLARARSLGGTFFLDEPLAHLDDLNRVALLDTLRIIVSEKKPSNETPRLVITTASNNLLRHLREKFGLVEGGEGSPALCIYEMNGNPVVGIKVNPPELVSSPNRL